MATTDMKNIVRLTLAALTFSLLLTSCVDDKTEEKALKAAERQKKITRAVCFFLAALMALGGTVGVIALFIK